MADFNNFDDDSIADSDDEPEVDLNDDDVSIDEYKGQDFDIQDLSKIKERTEDDGEDDLMFDLDETIDFETSLNYSIYSKKKTKSNISKITKYEFSKLVGNLSQYIADSKIDIPDDMTDEKIIETGDAIKIALFWVENRKKYKIPLSIKRTICNGVVEELDPSTLEIDDDYHFTDDNDVTSERFYQNFREKPYLNNS
uniref:Uncharacterized protein n=1 Tax=viral metagenome TaxID=1070528 RepID=A0A6C0BDG8_9ZZZZ